MKHLVAVLTSLLFVSTAHADGLPIPVERDTGRIATESGDVFFGSVSKRGWTTVRARAAAGDRVIDSVRIPGRYSIPLVAIDGTASGLSGDGRTLVLINPRKGLRSREETSFAVLSTDPLRLHRVVHLDGDFSFDALAPDGRSLFLINYLSARDFRKYRVRVYDLQRGRLEPKPIVDPREAPGEMNGFPLTRVVSRGGRWHYTLYAGKEHPFIHALDTRDRKAVCIDLELGHLDAYALQMELSPRGDALMLGDARGQVARVDTRTFDVAPVPAPAPAEAPATASDPEGPNAWLFAGLGGMVAWLALVGVLLRRSRVRRREAELDGLRAELGGLGPGAPVEEREGLRERSTAL